MNKEHMNNNLEFKDGKWVEAKTLEFEGGLLWKLKKLLKRCLKREG